MMSFLTDFGFLSNSQSGLAAPREQHSNPRDYDSDQYDYAEKWVEKRSAQKEYKASLESRRTGNRAAWTLLVYTFLSLGIFLRKTVNFAHVEDGVTSVFISWSVVAASFIIGLALLAPLLRIISKFHKGRLSWQHCLTAFTMGFFSDLTFSLLIKGFVAVIP